MRQIHMRLALLFSVTVLAFGCSSSKEPVSPETPAITGPPVHVVLFTHIEDQTPPGVLGTTTNRMA